MKRILFASLIAFMTVYASAGSKKENAEVLCPSAEAEYRSGKDCARFIGTLDLSKGLNGLQKRKTSKGYEFLQNGVAKEFFDEPVVVTVLALPDTCAQRSNGIRIPASKFVRHLKFISSWQGAGQAEPMSVSSSELVWSEDATPVTYKLIVSASGISIHSELALLVISEDGIRLGTLLFKLK